MSAEVVKVRRRGSRPPRALQVPEVITAESIDVLYDFGFEYFTPRMGTQRLVSHDDDSIDDYDDAAEIMRETGAKFALYDRDANGWVPLMAGDWVIEPQDDDGDGFIKLSDADFRAEWEVIT